MTLASRYRPQLGWRPIVPTVCGFGREMVVSSSSESLLLPLLVAAAGLVGLPVGMDTQRRVL